MHAIRGFWKRGVLALLASLAALPSPAIAQAPLRVMSFNIRLPAASDGVNAWDNRRALAVEMIRRADPDLIGTQELWKLQGDYLLAKLPRFAWFGIDRRGGRADEHMGVFYRRDRLELLDLGNFWLSDTPEIPGSISWGHPYPRMVTWGQFRRRQTGERFFLFNTHFPYRAEDDSARTRAAALLLTRIAAIAGDAPVVLTGDFNTVPGSEAHRLLSAGMADAWTSAASRSGPEATFHGFTGKPDRRIDWIFARGFRSLRARTIDLHRGPMHTSDHYPVLVELTRAPASAR